MTIEKIRILATKFRSAIERCDKQLLPPTFMNFPRGSCGDTAPLIGVYLEENGFGKFLYTSGYTSDRYSHAWIEQNNLIVDITADQFDKIEEKIIVTTDPTLHNTRFGLDKTAYHNNYADFRLYDDEVKEILMSAYNQIMRELKNY